VILKPYDRGARSVILARVVASTYRRKPEGHLFAQSERGRIGAAARPIALLAPTPDFLGERAPTTRRRRADQIHRAADAHVVRFTLHREDGGQPLPEILSAGRRGIKLVRRPPDACAPERIRASDVAGAAGPQQIYCGRIFFVTVNMADFDGAGHAAKRAYARTGRRASVRAVA
jgi:hypothetical protein